MATMFGSYTPGIVDAGSGSAVTTGTEFVALADCTLTHLRFHKAVANTGTHIGRVWATSNDGTYSPGEVMSTVTFTGETASGWQEQELPAPLTLRKGHHYVIAVNQPNGHWSEEHFFRSLIFDDPGSGGRLCEPVGVWNGRYQPSQPQLLGGIETGIKVTLAAARTITALTVCIRGGPESRTLQAHIWDDEGNLLASGSQAVVGVANVVTCPVIYLDEPIELPPGDYTFSVFDPIGALVHDGVDHYLLYDNPANGIEVTGLVYDFNSTGNVYPEGEDDVWFGVDAIMEGVPASGSWYPVNGGLVGRYNAESGTPSFPVQPNTFGESWCYFIDGVFEEISEGPEPVELDGEATAGATGSASLALAVSLTGAAVAAAVASGALSHGVPLQGSATTSASAAADLDVTGNAELNGAALTSAIASGNLALQVQLGGDALAGAVAAAQAEHIIHLAGGATASLSAIASLSIDVSLSGDAIAQISAGAELAKDVPLAGSAAAAAAAAGSLVVGVQLTGQATGGAAGSAALALEVPLAGDATGGAHAAGDLQGAAALGGAATAGVDAAATLYLQIPLTAQAVAHALAGGELSLLVNLQADAIAQALAGAALTVTASIELAGNALAGATATGALAAGVLLPPLTRARPASFKARAANITFRSRQASVRFH